MAEQYNEDEIIDESAEYSPKSEFSKAKVVMETVQKCIESRSKEMKSGYYNTTISKDGLPIKSWLQDTRKVYCSAIVALRRLLVPEILEDSIYKVKKEEEHPIKKIDKLIKKSKSDYSYYFLEKYTEGRLVKYKNTKNTFMPDIDSAVMVRKIFPDGNETLIEVRGYWNNKINAYWDNLVELSDDLFEELMRVIHRKNYFKSGVSY